MSKSKISKHGRATAYDRGQHMLVCEDLGVSRFASDAGPSAHEAVQDIQARVRAAKQELHEIALELQNGAFATSDPQISQVLQYLSVRTSLLTMRL